MQLLSFTHTADLVLSNFRKSTDRIRNNKYSQLVEQIKRCPFDVYLVGNQSPKAGRMQVSGIYANSLLELHQAWGQVFENPTDSQGLQQGLAVIDHYGNRVANQPGFLGFNIRRFSNPEDSPFFILVDRNFPVSATMEALWRLCNLWQVESGYIPLHASGIIHAGNLYIFSGPSGAGKSTIAKLSTAIGDEVLDDDQLMIYPKPDGTYSANAWGYSLKAGSAPIRAYFRIIKDKTDQLTPLLKTHTAKLLMEQACAVTGIMLPKKEYIRLFRQVADLGRNIGGYELHFRKSPDFWKLIDEELSGG